MPWFFDLNGYLPALLPLAWLSAAFIPCLPKLHRQHWLLTQVFASAAVVLAFAILATTLHSATPTHHFPLLAADSLSAVMVLMTSLVGWSILRFSRNYIDGEPGRLRFTLWFSLTLTSVTVLVLASHLAVLAFAWLATSLSLHRLLVFYPDRAKALLAAHKKFLVSRLADIMLVTGFVLIAQGLGSADIAMINERLQAGAGNGALSLEVAAVLIVLAAALKSAQLPFHGWLIQVMEAPTPVSALLHAGVVNMGGYLLIRLSPLLEATQFAVWLLLAIALATVAIASLVMMTRISIKVMLAWSTTAQMGFMLLECALGLYHLALVHLVAHSFYKAHTFLSSGQAPMQSLIRRGSNEVGRPRPAIWVLALSAGLGIFMLGHYVFGKPITMATLLTGAVLVTAVASLLAELGGALGHAGWRKALAASFAITGAYLLAEQIFGGLVPASAMPPAPSAFLLAAGVLALLLVARAHIMHRPEARLWQRVRPLLFNGLYLDEAFTRITFTLWPPKPRARREQPEPAPIYPDEGVSS